MAPEPVPGAVEDPDAKFRQLPSVMLLTEQIKLAREELVRRWDGWSGDKGRDEFPLLWQLWTTAKAQARQTLRDATDDPDASELLERWAQLDAEYGEPLRRGWVMSSTEAARRFETMTDYLHAAGELNVLQVRPDAPEEYLSREEMEGA